MSGNLNLLLVTNSWKEQKPVQFILLLIESKLSEQFLWITVLWVNDNILAGGLEGWPLWGEASSNQPQQTHSRKGRVGSIVLIFVFVSLEQLYF